MTLTEIQTLIVSVVASAVLIGSTQIENYGFIKNGMVELLTVKS
jgi:hypothetical protein